MSKRDETIAALKAVDLESCQTRHHARFRCIDAIRVLPLGTFADEVAEPERANDAQCEALRSVIMIFGQDVTCRDPKRIRYRGRWLSDIRTAEELEAVLLHVGASHPELCQGAIAAARAMVPPCTCGGVPLHFGFNCAGDVRATRPFCPQCETDLFGKYGALEKVRGVRGRMGVK